MMGVFRVLETPIPETAQCRRRSHCHGVQWAAKAPHANRRESPIGRPQRSQQPNLQRFVHMTVLAVACVCRALATLWGLNLMLCTCVGLVRQERSRLEGGGGALPAGHSLRMLKPNPELGQWTPATLFPLSVVCPCRYRPPCSMLSLLGSLCVCVCLLSAHCPSGSGLHVQVCVRFPVWHTFPLHLQKRL